jgi:hypothetical protein
MGLLSKLFGSKRDRPRRSKGGTEFVEATKGWTIIKRPGYRPAIGHGKRKK